MYKYVSNYGESYSKPLKILLVFVAFFTLLFPLAGLDPSSNGPQLVISIGASQFPPRPVQVQLSYRQFSNFVNQYPDRRWFGYASFFGNSLMTVLSVAGFQKELKYQPSYPLGRALGLLELLVTSSLIALFLLALRRQFKR